MILLLKFGKRQLFFRAFIKNTIFAVSNFESSLFVVKSWSVVGVIPLRRELLHPGENKAPSGCSVARLSRLLWEQEVASSNLATPTPVKSSLSEILRGFFVLVGYNIGTTFSVKSFPNIMLRAFKHLSQNSYIY